VITICAVKLSSAFDATTNYSKTSNIHAQLYLSFLLFFNQQFFFIHWVRPESHKKSKLYRLTAQRRKRSSFKTDVQSVPHAASHHVKTELHCFDFVFHVSRLIESVIVKSFSYSSCCLPYVTYQVSGTPSICRAC